MKKIAIGLCVMSAAVLWTCTSVQAHGLIGKCFLPATLAIDDPFVADELSLPTVSHIKTRASNDSPADLKLLPERMGSTREKGSGTRSLRAHMSAPAP